MNPTFEKLHRQLGRATFSLLFVTLAAYGITVLCALLGLPHAVVSLKGAAASAAYAFGAVLSLFLVGSGVAAVSRWFDRRKLGSGSSAL